MHDIIKSKGIFPLMLLAEDTTARPERALEDVETTAVQLARHQELRKELEEVKRRNELLGSKWNGYKISHKISETKLVKE